MIKCKVCDQEFETDKSLHAHIKKHGLYQAEYYCKYYPKFSLFYKKQIPFLNKKDYFSKEFLDLNEFLLWEKSVESDLAKAKCLDLFQKRIAQKKYSYGPCHNELNTLNLPPINILKKHFKSYTKACSLLGLEPLLNKPMPKKFIEPCEAIDFEMLVDTREQDPLPFKKTKVEKLYVGDYLLNNGEYTYTYVDRKSESDFLGTMAGGISRFKKEIEKAVALESYLFVVVESDINKIKSNQSKFRKKSNLEYVFHNMRSLTHEYPRRIQFIFTGSRKKSMQIIPRLLYYGKELWNVDIQYYLDYELGNR
jgi:hypothetical protein